MIDEEWRELREFSRYDVSTRGRVRDALTGRIMTQAQNQQGFVMVSLQDGVGKRTRSVAVLVVDEFIPPRVHFNSLIHLDGDRSNCRLENLERRPRWFAIKYHRQFEDPVFIRSTPKLVNVVTGEEFDDFVEPATKYGLHYKDIVLSAMNRELTPFTPQEFAWR